jgi:glycosyltransferase involved in cell wall biosynthesis
LKKLYIDVTESYAWEGKVTGIIRVMDELADRFFADRNIQSTFVIWNEKYASFREIDYQEILQRRAEQEPNMRARPAPQTVAPISEKPTIKLPLSRTTTRLVNYQKAKLTKYMQPKDLVQLTRGSILFMPHGGVWGSKTYAASVLELQLEGGIKLVPILYDMCPVISPQFCSEGIRRIFNRYMKKVLVKSDLVLAISENTARDAQTWIKNIHVRGIPAIQVFRLGDEIGSSASRKPRNKKLPEQFMLCVGTIEARKNHTCLYYAYKLAQQQNIELPPVVVVGRKGWLAEDIYEIITTDPSIKDKFIFIHDASDNELAWLYENTTFLVYPSFYEGWGLPIAESLLRGVPCLASNTSSIPEIAGDLVEYFSPYSPEELMEKMQSLNNPKIRAEKRKKIRATYKATSWDKSYGAVFSALEKI